MTPHGHDATEAHPDPQRELDDDVPARSARRSSRFAVEAEERRVRRRDGQRARRARTGRGCRRPPREPARLRVARQPGSRHPVAELARAAVGGRGRDHRDCDWWPARSSRRCDTRCSLAKDLATLDLLSEGRLVVQPTVSWHRAEYDALGVPFASRGALLDEHLAAWDVLWRDSPASFEGTHYRFHDVFLEPKPFRPDGPTLWFGGSSLHERLLRRIVTVRARLQPAWVVRHPEDLDAAARTRWPTAGRSIDELEMVGRDARRVPRLRRAWPTSNRRCRRSPSRSQRGLHVDLHQAVTVHRRSRRRSARSAARSWSACRRS